MLVLCGIHIISELISSEPKLGFKANSGRRVGFLNSFSLFSHETGLSNTLYLGVTTTKHLNRT